jgi:phosphatidylglycerol:prolipoprotein diacylglycerol transferase
VSPLLFIPWFKAEPVYIPLPFSIPALEHGLPIQPFGVLVAIGVLLGIRLSEEFASRNGLSRIAAYDFSIYTVIPGFIGALVLNVVFYDFENFIHAFSDPIRLMRWNGLSSYGGFFGAAAGMFIWKRKYKESILVMSDCAAFGLPFGWFFGRMGCFVVHDHPGRVTDFFLAVDDYHTGSPPYFPRHDLGFYEVLWSVVISAIFLVLWRKTRRPGGFYLSVLILAYAPFRFFLDFLRAEVSEGGDVRYFGLTPGHYSSIAFLILGLYLARRVMTEPPVGIPPELAGPIEPESLAHAYVEPSATAPATSTSGSARASGSKSGSGSSRSAKGKKKR